MLGVGEGAVDARERLLVAAMHGAVDSPTDGVREGPHRARAVTGAPCRGRLIREVLEHRPVARLCGVGRGFGCAKGTRDEPVDERAIDAAELAGTTNRNRAPQHNMGPDPPSTPA